MKKKTLLILSITIIVLLDQLSKYLIVKSIPLGTSYTVINNFFKLSTYFNNGAAYGILNNKTYLIIIISTIIFAFLVIELMKPKKSKIEIISYTMIIGGLIGNLIDRIFLGYVRDFFDFKIFSHECAIFNIADTFIVIGTILLCIYFVMEALNEYKSRKR